MVSHGLWGQHQYRNYLNSALTAYSGSRFFLIQQNAILLVTEGHSNMNRGMSPREATQAREAGISVMGVGIGVKVDGIKKIVRDDGKLVLVRDYLELMDVIHEVSALVCKGNAYFLHIRLIYSHNYDK